MLIRRTEQGTILISQPAHARLSGDLARAWGNADFAPPWPFEDFCFAAEQHDNGWLEWEGQPRLNGRTGLPQEFWDVPAVEHTKLWRGGVQRMLAYGRLPALLVSLHGDTIYAHTFDSNKASPENVSAVTTFLAEQHSFQESMINSLRADPLARDFASDEHLKYCQTLLLIVDQISLHMCWGIDDAVKVPGAPGREGVRDLRLSVGAGRSTIEVNPWPFCVNDLALRIEGKLMTRRHETEEALRADVAQAQPVSIAVKLRR